MIFAAGLGTRLKPLTDTMPKALVEVKGVTLLRRVAEKLAAEGFRDIVINVHHFADMIEAYLKDNSNFGLNIQISSEREQLLDTGGAIRKAKHLFNPTEPLLIHNVDIVSNARLTDLYNMPIGTDASLLVSERDTTRYLLFDDDMLLAGWTNLKTGEIKSPYGHIDPQRYHRLAFSGIHCLSGRLIGEMERWPERFGIIDFYLANCRKYKIKAHLQHGLKLTDIGKTDVLWRINQGLDELPC